MHYVTGGSFKEWYFKLPACFVLIVPRHLIVHFRFQEIALMREFSVRDALQHFGWIYGMDNSSIDEKFRFLTELLDLPPANMKVKNLSGGQQRRVSLAVALVSRKKMQENGWVFSVETVQKKKKRKLEQPINRRIFRFFFFCKLLLGNHWKQP